VTPGDGVGIVQGHAIERLQVILRFAGRDRVDYLIEMEIDKYVRGSQALVRDGVARVRKEDAAEGHRKMP
jgi:hypothetical protein